MIYKDIACIWEHTGIQAATIPVVIYKGENIMFKEGNRCHVWEAAEPKKKGQKFADVKISTSAKDQDDEWYTDFSAYTRFCGEAFKKLTDVEEGDIIVLTSIGVTNSYDKKKKVTYTNYLVFDFEFPEASEEAPKKKATRK